MSKISITPNASGTGVFTISSPATNTNRTLTLPDEAGTVLTSASSITQNAGPAFSAAPSVNQSVSAGSWVKVILDDEHFDTNDNFASSRFTPNVAGYYQINGGTYCPSCTRLLSAILKNGAHLFYGSDLTTVTSEQRSRISALIYMNGTSDYLELYGLSFNGTVWGASTANSFFNGALVRAA
jgi:hypothetical protein